MNGICAVVGAQFGSEGKGGVVAHIAKDYQHHVRVGAANAGHTLYTRRPADPDPDVAYGVGQFPVAVEKHVMQQLPCAAYANPHAELYIGPGALISPEIFNDELDRNWRWREERGYPAPRVFVDPRAHVITDDHIEVEQRSGLAERIGSTSTIAKEGIGAAAAARVMRDAGCCTAKDYFGDEGPEDVPQPIYLADVPMLLHAARGGILLEGTQGHSLSNTTGFFPYVTSRNTTAAGLAADAGVAPTRIGRVILVARTYPIRVAGPSGPFFADSREIDWPSLNIDPENERTTVTKLVRRVATFSKAQLREAAAVNGATEIALTFADYLEPDLAGMTGPAGMAELGHYEALQSMLDDVIDSTGLPVSYITTGPHHVIEFLQPTEAV